MSRTKRNNRPFIEVLIGAKKIEYEDYRRMGNKSMCRVIKRNLRGLYWDLLFNRK